MLTHPLVRLKDVVTLHMKNKSEEKTQVFSWSTPVIYPS